MIGYDKNKTLQTIADGLLIESEELGKKIKNLTEAKKQIDDRRESILKKLNKE
jgi:hypothetical protein